MITLHGIFKIGALVAMLLGLFLSLFFTGYPAEAVLPPDFVAINLTINATEYDPKPIVHIGTLYEVQFNVSNYGTVDINQQHTHILQSFIKCYWGLADSETFNSHAASSYRVVNFTWIPTAPTGNRTLRACADSSALGYSVGNCPPGVVSESSENNNQYTLEVKII